MKKIILLLTGLTLSTGIAFSQTTEDHSTHEHAKAEHAKHHVHKADHRAEHLTKKLGLTSEQKAKVHALSLSEGIKVADFKKQHANDPAAMHREVKAVRENFKQQMKTILTPEQYKKWGKLKKAGKKQIENESPDTDDLDD